MRSPPEPARDTRCYRCGGRLGMGQTILYRMEPSEANQRPTSLLRLRESFLWQSRQPQDDTICQRCGTKSAGRGRTATYSNLGRDNLVKRLLLRLRWALSRSVTTAKVGGRHRVDAEDRIDLSHLLANATFPAYGLKHRPRGLRLRSLGWGSRGRGHIVSSVSLLYVTEEPSEPQRAIELSQAADINEDSSVSLRMADLRAVKSVVRSYGSRKLMQEYRSKGNIHRDWNLERISRTSRRQVTIHVDGESVKVELAYWWRPQPVVLAHIRLEHHSIRAASVGITHIELLTLLKTMTVLQHDPDVLAEHQQDNDQNRFVMPDR